MVGIREKKREELRQKIIKAASSIMATEGLQGIKAREIADKAGCALGSLYTVFPDLDHLVLQVNLDTLKSLGKALDRQAAKETSQEDKLAALAKAYLAFAARHYNVWEALFYHQMADGFPEWYIQEHAFLLEKISQPLSHIFSDLSEEELMIRSKTFFSAVHGIVSLGMLEPFIAVPKDQLEEQLAQFVESAVRGYRDV